MSDRLKDQQSEKRAGAGAELGQRDTAVERMLARRADGRAGAAECPDAEVIAAYLDRSLDADETARCEEHFADCSRCQDVLASLTASENVEAVAADPVPVAATAAPSRAGALIVPAEQPVPRRTVWRWLVPLAVATAAIILWFDLRPKPSSAPVDNRQVASNAIAQPPASEPATPAPAGPGGESKTNEAAPTNRKKDSKPLEVNGSMQSNPAAKQTRVRSGDQATRSDAFGNSASGSSQVAEALRDESALEKSAISNTMPTPLPLPGQASAADQSPGRGGAAGTSNQPLQADARRPYAEAQSSTVQSSRQDQPAKEKVLSAPARASGMIGGNFIAANAGTILISPTNGDTVWRIGPRGRIERSTDSGNTWQSTPAGVVADLLAGAAPANGVAWIVGKSGTILRTTDGGAHWTQPKSPTFGSEQAPDWSSVVATDADHATISSLTGQSFITTDGGATWSPQQQ